MKKLTIFIVIGILIFLAILVWAPWFSTEKAYAFLANDENYKRACRNYQPTIPQPHGISNIHEIIRPGIFGKTAIDCGRQWYITFWGHVYIDD